MYGSYWYSFDQPYYAVNYTHYIWDHTQHGTDAVMAMRGTNY